MLDELAPETDRLSEGAAALALNVARFEDSLAALMRHRALPPAVSPRARARQAEEQRHLRDRTRLHLWHLIAQREALGLRQHEPLLRHYQLPAELVGPAVLTPAGAGARPWAAQKP